MVAEGTHPVAKIRGARGEGPVRGAWRAHAGILSCRTDFAFRLMKCSGIAQVTQRSGKKSETPVENFTLPALLNATEPRRMPASGAMRALDERSASGAASAIIDGEQFVVN
jgi:hypothetical protein